MKCDKTAPKIQNPFAILSASPTLFSMMIKWEPKLSSILQLLAFLICEQH